jgi:tetratricopeptide (TPR) repeat protein
MRKAGRNLFTLFLVLLFNGAAYGQSRAPFERLNSLYTKKDFKTLEQECQKNLQVAPKGDEIYFETLYFLIAERIYQGDLQSAVPYMKLFRDAHVAREEAASRKAGVHTILIDARFPGLYYELGKYYFDTENWVETVRWLRLAKTGDPSKDPMLYFRLGTAYMKTGEYDQARKYLGIELELNPKEPSPFYNTACSFALQKNKGKTLEWLRKSVAAYPPYGPQAAKDADFAFLTADPEFKKITTTP